MKKSIALRDFLTDFMVEHREEMVDLGVGAVELARVPTGEAVEIDMTIRVTVPEYVRIPRRRSRPRR